MRPIVTDRVAWSVALSVCCTSEPCKNGWSDRDAVWVVDSGGPKEPCIRWAPDPFMGRGNFEGKYIVKYRHTLRSSVQRRLNRSRCRLGCGLGWPQGIVLYGGPEVLRDVVMATNFGMQFAITGFVWMIVTRWLVMEGVWVVIWQNADIADNLQLRDLVRQPFFGFHWAITLVVW